MSSFLNIFPFNVPLPYAQKRDIEDADESSNSMKHSMIPKSYNCPNKKWAVAGLDHTAFDKERNARRSVERHLDDVIKHNQVLIEANANLEAQRAEITRAVSEGTQNTGSSSMMDNFQQTLLEQMAIDEPDKDSLIASLTGQLKEAEEQNKKMQEAHSKLTQDTERLHSDLEDLRQNLESVLQDREKDAKDIEETAKARNEALRAKEGQETELQNLRNQNRSHRRTSAQQSPPQPPHQTLQQPSQQPPPPPLPPQQSPCNKDVNMENEDSASAAP
ncbi:hypothetical protein GYMLUDRAFT_78166 [Collybiopsis luxurians FD-317 M1]|uniref:Uncharacterized protein n=1 Tax=Collybiopsis luxurians FD-317 M1 TaxID=944289 RepID=A0A0D0AML6_9AGAR|nr:hypothetical protein GYMLUDRAFT_78166 [Collybiopsis luxurians FD-317 M1]